MKIKVLTLTTVYPNAQEPGLGIFVRTRLRQMAEQAEIKVMAPIPLLHYHGGPKRGRPGPKYRWDGPIEVISPGWIHPPRAGAWNGIFLFLQVLGPMLRIRRRFPFQIVDVHFGHPEGVAAALACLFLDQPFTVTLRGSEQLHGRYWLRRKGMSWAFRRAARVIAVSERLRNFAIALGASPAHCVTIPNGIDTAVFHPRDRAAARQEYGIRGSEKAILSVGHLVELKGHHRIISTLPGLVGSGFDVVLLIAGSRGRALDYETELRRQAAALGLAERVRFLGHLQPDSLAQLMNAVDLFCLASSREGWPNVVHEALACGTPVVAADVGAVPEMIPSEAFGLIVPPNQVELLEAGLKKALDRDWDRAGIARWGQMRSWSQVATEVLEVMRSVVEERGKPC